MIIIPTSIAGACVVALEPIEDDRGWFARTWCAEEFAEHGLDAQLTQCNVSWSRYRGTVRGMHYQVPPYAEAKLVRAVRGAIYDVVADLRPDSPTFGHWAGVELSAQNHLALFIPALCAHGLQTLVDDTEVLYQMSAPYAPGAARGVRWDDTTLNIRWPWEVTVVSDRDRSWPALAAQSPGHAVTAAG